MTNDSIVFIGLDTHKESTEVAYSPLDRRCNINHLGKIRTTRQALEKLARQLHSKYPRATLHFVYEAGPCGYWVYRLLTRLGHVCYVVAPSLIPKKPGHRVKTDKRDAIMLTQLLQYFHRITETSGGAWQGSHRHCLESTSKAVPPI